MYAIHRENNVLMWSRHETYIMYLKQALKGTLYLKISVNPNLFLGMELD